MSSENVVLVAAEIVTDLGPSLHVRFGPYAEIVVPKSQVTTHDLVRGVAVALLYEDWRDEENGSLGEFSEHTVQMFADVLLHRTPKGE